MRADGSRIAISSHHRAPLDSGWELAAAPPGGVPAIERDTPLDTTRLDTLAWRPIAGATTVADALRAAGNWRFDEPADFDATEWWFRCTFDADIADGSARTTLRFAGLATIADVWLNGAPLVSSDNMFVAHACDVTGRLATRNTLYVRCASLRDTLRVKRPRPAWRTRLVEQQQLRWLRTTLLGRMPGFSPTPQTIGPWRPVTLDTERGVSARVTMFTSRVEENDGIVELTLRVRADTGTTITGATLAVGDHRAPLTLQRDGDELVLTGTLRIADVERWWPHTHGTPYRYPAAITLDGSATTTITLGHVGFRTITLDTADGNFALSVNGVPIFCRGACWTTVDVAAPHGTDAQYDAALTLARDAGMNMLRVGGTMLYEADAFYEQCDALGILVWQDFMFANMDYPFDDPQFAASVRDEIEQFLERTRTCAALAILCGNSEIEQQTSMLGLPPERWSHPFFQETLPALCRAARSDVAYWPSSPSGGTFPFHVDAGDAHYFGYGPYLRPFDDVRTSGVRFASETLAFAHVPDQATIDLLSCGTAGAGHHPAWKAGVPRDNGASWDFEDVRDHYVRELFRVDSAQLRYSDVERYLALGRVASGEVMERAIGEWRRAGSRCGGALLWFYRDLRPGAGWGVVDATGRPKAAYYAFRRVARPVSVLLADDGLNGVGITLVNESAHPIDAELRVALYRHGDVLVGSASASRRLAPRTSVAERADTLFRGFLDLSYAYRFGPPNHDLIVATLVEAKSGETLHDSMLFPTGLPTTREAELGVTATATPLGDGRYTLAIAARRFAQSVAIDIEHFLPDDNYLHVAPGATRTVTLRPTRESLREGRMPSGTVTPLNAALATRVVVATTVAENTSVSTGLEVEKTESARGK